jgi:hypothetical protein
MSKILQAESPHEYTPQYRELMETLDPMTMEISRTINDWCKQQKLDPQETLLAIRCAADIVASIIVMEIEL